MSPSEPTNRADAATRPRKTVEVSALVHKSMPACCKASVLTFAAGDRYQGGGEPGDQIKCGCGNTLVYAPSKNGRVIGWRVRAGEHESGEA